MAKRSTQSSFRRSASFVTAMSAFAAITFTASASRAGGPLEVFDVGQPYVWPAGGVGITFNPDQGFLGPFTNVEAVDRVEAAFGAWEDVTTSSISFLTGTALPVDVDETNFGTYLFADFPDGFSAVVFDANGAIFDGLFGPGSGILGFAGPEWLDQTTGDIIEGLAFINGGAILENPDPLALAGTLVHEFGHWNNLAHSQVNGALFLGQVSGIPDFDHAGPGPNNTFPLVDLTGQVETMYPFLVEGSGSEVLKADDIAAISRLYPTPDFPVSSGTITGAILSAGSEPLDGVNVIARNVADPFGDAVSGLAGELTLDKGDDFTGLYTLPGLTAGATYAVYADEIVTGEFRPAAIALPAPEELYNGAAESNNPATDNPAAFTPLSPLAGEPLTDIDIVLNAPAPGPLTIGDDEAIELRLPFDFEFCGQTYANVFVSSNGNLTFGEADPSFDAQPRDHLGGVPRIAPLWADLVPDVAGVVAFAQTATTFTVTWTDVPEFPDVGANTFSVTLHASRPGHHRRRGQRPRQDVGGDLFTFAYGDVAPEISLAGYSCGGRVTSGFELERDIGDARRSTFHAGTNDTTVYEWFSDADSDLSGDSLSFRSPNAFADRFEPNNTFSRAARVRLPFSTVDTRTSYSEIDVDGGDVDFYRFRAEAGQTLLVETAIGPFMDSLIGLFDAAGTLLATDDDGLEFAGASQLVFDVPSSGDFFVGVSSFPDFDFLGEGADFGRYVLTIRAFRGEPVLSAVFPGEPLADDDYGIVSFRNFRFPFQGRQFSNVFVSSNGNLTFGAPPSDPLNDLNDFSPNVPDFLAGPRRVAALWRDLSPTDAETLEQKGAVLAERERDALKVHYVGLPEFNLGGTNTVSVTLTRDGRVGLDYGPTNREYALVGITEGRGADDPGPTDLSLATTLSSNGTTYEEFFHELVTFGGDDLAFDKLTFRRRGQPVLFSAEDGAEPGADVDSGPIAVASSAGSQGCALSPQRSSPNSIWCVLGLAATALLSARRRSSLRRRSGGSS
jgi:hypothetical protein